MRYFKQIFNAIKAKLKDTGYVINTNDETVKYKLPAKYRAYDRGKGFGAYIKIYNPEVQNCGKSGKEIILPNPLICFWEDYDCYSHYSVGREIVYGNSRVSTDNIPYDSATYRESYVKAKDVLEYIETGLLDDLNALSEQCILLKQFEEGIKLSTLKNTYADEDNDDD